MSKVTEMSANILDESLSQLDKKYRMQDKDKSAAKAESCCMVAIIILGQIYIANAGDAKVVLGRLVRPKGRVRLILERWARLTPHIQAIPLLAGEHPILQFPREELELMHPMDHSILHYSDKSLAKGLIPTGILHAPTLFQDELLPEDKFIIFGSSELWRYLKNEEAVAMVRKLSRRVRFLHPTLDFVHIHIFCTNKFLCFISCRESP
ncbi:probable protein phosphatase 2C 38 isoform X2 [Salvia hispanica]|uniref:probable protein phosphatase 2C 38 isoform X2 n=1 Tax=Salvia hispanica TaxID=49212 RepID=UPI002009A44A|nr:probable protein phosphatase 2C 38 isoform X2 [Salvia hispanica]